MQLLPLQFCRSQQLLRHGIVFRQLRYSTTESTDGTYRAYVTYVVLETTHYGQFITQFIQLDTRAHSNAKRFQ